MGAGHAAASCCKAQLGGQGVTCSANVGGSNGRCNVVIGGGNVSGEGAEGVEGGLIAPLQLLGHVLWDLVHRHMAWTLVHDL